MLAQTFPVGWVSCGHGKHDLAFNLINLKHIVLSLSRLKQFFPPESRVFLNLCLDCRSENTGWTLWRVRGKQKVSAVGFSRVRWSKRTENCCSCLHRVFRTQRSGVLHRAGGEWWRAVGEWRCWSSRWMVRGGRSGLLVKCFFIRAESWHYSTCRQVRASSCRTVNWANFCISTRFSQLTCSTERPQGTKGQRSAPSLGPLLELMDWVSPAAASRHVESHRCCFSAADVETCRGEDSCPLLMSCGQVVLQNTAAVYGTSLRRLANDTPNRKSCFFWRMFVKYTRSRGPVSTCSSDVTEGKEVT